MTKYFLLITCVLALLTPLLVAEEVEDINLAQSRFFIDHAVFADSINNRLEVYYKIFNDGLNYVKKGDKFVADYEVNVIIIGDKEKQVTGKSVEKTYMLDSYESTRLETGYLINQINIPLTPGNYGLVCKLIDHNSNEVSTIEAKVNSYSFNRSGDLADIEFIQEKAEPDEYSPFTKAGFAVLPTVERSLDGELQKLGFYTEVYAAGYLGQTLNLRYRIENKRRGEPIDSVIMLKVESPVVSVREFVPIVDLYQEEYDLRLTLLSGDNILAERKTRFHLKWTVSSLVKNDFEYAVSQLRYIIKKEEKKELLDAPDSLRLEAFEKFWKDHDPTPTTARNELRDEYYRRIRYANQYYSTTNREGWGTDRGMVYIKYGEPDQIERHPFEMDTKPSQIWYYYTQRRTFAFLDSRGDGDYQLQYPYDGDWRSGVGP
ncbi:MAG: GWxTD domain-containing protein [Candidatus Zixiibacteriota bacterium]|nr:MAG: GWxTD domain-containing protein [candidate division Zixibacteria bacterium]